MTSSHWDAALAERYRRFQYEFPDHSLRDQTLVLAGGSGGLGAATAFGLAREGARLVISYRSNRLRAESLRDAIDKQYGTRVSLVEGELSLPETRQSILRAAQATGTPLAGAAIFSGDAARVSLEALDGDSLARSFEANCAGPVLLARDLGQKMEEGGGGAIVFLATMQAVAVFASSLNYAAPKAALVHAARILAQEWSRVRVNVVAPGATVAGMAEASVRSGKYDRFIEQAAIPRFGRPEDIARAVRFFCEPDNYITGQVLVVDGGLTIRRHRP